MNVARRKAAIAPDSDGGGYETTKDKEQLGVETELDRGEIESALQCIRDAFDASGFPREFLEKYDQIECLSCHNGRETFVVREKASGRLFVAKCREPSAFQGASGSAILRTLHHQGLPAFADAFENERAACVVREYIEGTPLDRYAGEQALAEEEIIRLCVQLCDILAYLHEQSPPVIHRDVKPQNIIIRESGAPVLIDFDTARRYQSGAKADTEFFGTREYAPPEQYGFTQTDCRADIYALGVVLRFLCTGDTKEGEDNRATAFLRRIIRKCTAFSPDKRFHSVRAVRKALLAASLSRRVRRKRLLTAFLTATVFLCAGYALGRYTYLLAVPEKGVSFAEPLIESAVRVQLNKADGEIVTKDDLMAVRALYIFGSEVSGSETTFVNGFADRDRGARGGVVSLDDLAMMPNLEKIQIAYQALEDMSGLLTLQKLTSVSVMHTRVSDVSPLAHMMYLESANFYDTNVSDASALSGCPRLRRLDLGATPVSSPEQIGCCDTLESLSLKGTRLHTLRGVERFKRLKTLYAGNAEAPDWEELRHAPALETVYVDETMEASLSRRLEGSGLAILIEK